MKDHAAKAAAAALNNARWCRAVCRAHGDAGVIDDALWLHAGPVPRFYPNAVSLRPGDDGIVDRLRDLQARSSGGTWSVKDSFATLDLSGLGCTELFTAQWIWRDAPSARGMPIGWQRVVGDAALQAWEHAWAADDAEPGQRVFLPALLADADVAVWAQVEQGEVVAGGICSRSPGAVGLSNLFGADRSDVVVAMVDLAAAIAPGLPVVGYERDDEWLAACAAAGFEAVGPLRVWIRS